ncbi:hypothetical protein SAMN05444272_4199 [Roseibium suaedae]|uniref:Uncharacterized protein n=1 Tax=Roseibium suaedae TaxID=735517 RepID=A0A1M7P8F5_9HYPH|nr:hypothetical protein SAMN05444272_4199 [Roseibium suaedae]
MARSEGYGGTQLPSSLLLTLQGTAQDLREIQSLSHNNANAKQLSGIVQFDLRARFQP